MLKKDMKRIRKKAQADDPTNLAPFKSIKDKIWAKMVTGVVERKTLKFFPVRVNPKLSIKNVTGSNFFNARSANETHMSVEPIQDKEILEINNNEVNLENR